MGPHRRGPIQLSTARVVPDVPSFSVDDGFLYRVPEGMTVGIGSLVRVPLGGRRVRGWVVGTGEPEKGGLKEILSRSGDLPVFDRDLLGVLRWAAAHYVAPLAALLAKATPPNLPRSRATVDSSAPPSRRSRPRLLVGRGPWADRIAQEARETLADGRSVLVVAPTVPEAEELSRALSERLGRDVEAVWSGRPAADVTKAWVRAATRSPGVIVGTREVSAWPVKDLGLAVVMGEGRRGMKDKATPTVHARDLLLRRSAVERFDVLLTEHVPTAEALARVGEVETVGRPWGLVEIVDRNQDPPGSGLFSPVTAAALRAATDRRILLFSHRRAVAQRCVKCRTMRRCPVCEAAPGEGTECARCGATVGACTSCGGKRFETMGAPVSRVLSEAARIVPRDEVGPAGSGRRVVVGSERDLPGLEVDLVVVVDGDGPLMAPSYRASEDGFRVIGRALAAAGEGRGRRGIVQTAAPESEAMVALRRADPVGFVRGDAKQRAALGFPPGGEIIVLEVRDLPEGMAGEVAAELGNRASVHGPAEAPSGLRWLIQGRDLDKARVVLRSVVSRWREAGARVRVDADPVDL